MLKREVRRGGCVQDGESKCWGFVLSGRGWEVKGRGRKMKRGMTMEREEESNGV